MPELVEDVPALEGLLAGDARASGGEHVGTQLRRHAQDRGDRKAFEAGELEDLDVDALPRATRQSNARRAR